MRFSFFLLPALLLVLQSCHYMGGERVRGDGNVITQERSHGDFSGVRVKGSMDLFLTQGPAHSVRIEADGNLMEYIEVVREGNVLEVGPKRGYNLRPSRDIKVYVTAPSFEVAEVVGSGDIRSSNRLSSPRQMEVGIRGSGDIQMEVDAPEVEVDISGSGTVALSGHARALSAGIRGSGDVKCFNLLSETAEVDISGSGNAQVTASRQLNVDIRGAGDVSYRGNPSVNQQIRGAGSVHKAE